MALLRIYTTIAYPAFVAFVLDAQPYQEEMILDAGGTTIKHIYISRLSKMRIALPPVEEQVELIMFLRTVRHNFRKRTSLVLASIIKLQEYRSTLITAAVTGQIEELH